MSLYGSRMSVTRLATVAFFVMIAFAPGASAAPPTVPVVVSLKYSHNANAEWREKDQKKNAVLRAISKTGLAGCSLEAETQNGFTADRITFEFVDLTMNTPTPYLKVYTKLPGQTKYHKVATIPSSKLQVADMREGWHRATWMRQGGLDPLTGEALAKVIIVTKPNTGNKFPEKSELHVRNIVIDGRYQPTKYVLTAEKVPAAELEP